MQQSSKRTNNSLIRKSILRMVPACFATSIAGSMSLLVDSLLAGSLISQIAIAAVAIGNPITAIFRALIQAISNGAIVRLTINIGRGEREESSRTFSLGLIGSLFIGAILVAFTMLTADKLVLLFGGASNPQAAKMAALYLRSCSLMIVGGSLNLYLTKVLAIFGHQKESFAVALLGAVLNTVTSILFTKMLPAEYAIAGLGIGTCIGSLTQTIIFSLLLIIKRVPLQLRLVIFKPAELMNMLKLGFPSSSNDLIDGMITALVNNIILRGFGGDTLALSVYTAVKGVFGFAQVSCITASMTASPLFGLLYGARDKNGIKRTLRETYKVCLAFSVVWCGILILLMPVLLKIFGMAGNPDLAKIVRSGVYITMAFIPVILALRIMTTLFEATEKLGMGLLYSIIPDSVIYPLMLAALLPSLKYTGIWLAFGSNGLIFLVLLYLIRSMLNKSMRISADRLLCLDESVRDNVPMIDFSIFSNNDIASKLSKRVQEFMVESGASQRSAYMTALCLEELAADFSARSTAPKNDQRELMDIKLFSDDSSIRIIIRNAADPYNPLNYDPNDEVQSKAGIKLVQKVAQHIEYSYVYKMNIITIDLAK